jgi:rhodanese-related sulfurtransferase
MGIFSAMAAADINEGVAEFKQTKGAVLIDVREPDEFAKGHIPGAISIPLQQFVQIQEAVPDKSAPLFVYCQFGGRSKRACTGFTKLGYANAKNIGGIDTYTGPKEHSSAW